MSTCESLREMAQSGRYGKSARPCRTRPVCLLFATRGVEQAQQSGDVALPGQAHDVMVAALMIIEAKRGRAPDFRLAQPVILTGPGHAAPAPFAPRPAPLPRPEPFGDGSDGEPWFVASDICRVLGLRNASKALQGLDDDEKGITNCDTLWGLSGAFDGL